MADAYNRNLLAMSNAQHNIQEKAELDFLRKKTAITDHATDLYEKRKAHLETLSTKAEGLAKIGEEEGALGLGGGMALRAFKKSAFGKKVLETGKKKLGDLMDRIRKVGKYKKGAEDTIEDAGDETENLMDKAKGFGRDMFGKLKSKISDVGENIQDKFSNVADRLKNGLGDKVSDLQDTVKSNIESNFRTSGETGTGDIELTDMTQTGRMPIDSDMAQNLTQRATEWRQTGFGEKVDKAPTDQGIEMKDMSKTAKNNITENPDEENVGEITENIQKSASTNFEKMKTNLTDNLEAKLKGAKSQLEEKTGKTPEEEEEDLDETAETGLEEGVEEGGEIAGETIAETAGSAIPGFGEALMAGLAIYNVIKATTGEGGTDQDAQNLESATQNYTNQLQKAQNMTFHAQDLGGHYAIPIANSQRQISDHFSGF